MLQLLITTYGQQIDYSRYVDWTTVQVSEQQNIPSTMTFNLLPCDGRFKVPPRMAYVQLWSTVQQKSVFSGYINTSPVYQYMALSDKTPPDAGGQLFTYVISCTSDEYLINLKAVPFIPAFVNRYQGDILTTIANILCPGFFDTSNVMQGDLVPFLQYDPTQTWCELAKQFGDGSRYRYKVRDKKIWYVPYGDQPLGISYAEDWKRQNSFSPTDLKTTILSVPIINDLTIIGDVEAGNNREDYFIGDGFTGNYQLLHKVFRGSSTDLINESWNEQQLNTQQWFVLDPGDNFSYNAGALNIVDTLSTPFESGQSYLSMNNGIELAGGTDVQVGECIFADYSDGILGGLYTATDFTDDEFIAGFVVTSPSGVITSASGAYGVNIQPSVSGQLLGAPLVTQINHSYVLQIVITAPNYVRFQQTFRTIDGEEYGGASLATSGNITFNIQDYDIGAATGIFYNPNVTTYALDGVNLPPFAVLALINNHKLNVSIVNTTVAVMPLGGLQALVGPSGLMQPTGLILPMLPPGSGGFIGVASDVSGAASGNILLPPGLLSTTLQNLVLGNGYDLQAAQITQGNSADTLGFYTQSLPAAGTLIRFQSWESQAAVARLQVSGDIANQAALVGDDGIRSAIVRNLNPLPRTSEDCTNAALAQLQDVAGDSYNGTYLATNVPGASFFVGTTSDEQYWPTVGRFFPVNAPKRRINGQKFLVSQLGVTVLNPQIEAMQWQVQFGSDLILEKTLQNFVDLRPVNVLTPQDTAAPPVPFFTQNVTNQYLPDLQQTRVDLTTIGDTINVQVLDAWAGLIEVRRLDTNWGNSQKPPQPAPPPWNNTVVDSTLIGVFKGPVFQLTRQQVDQVWYLRPVTEPNNAFGVITSRRSKVLRVLWPLKPSVPLFVGQNSTVLQFNFNGDNRNIYGFELRATITQVTPGFPQQLGQQIVLVQKPVASYADMTLDLLQTDFLSLLQAGDPAWTLQAYFFNTNWVYSDPLTVNAVNPPNPIAGQAITLTPVMAPSGVNTAQIDLGLGTNQNFLNFVLNRDGNPVNILPPIDSVNAVIPPGTTFTLYLINGVTGNVQPTPNFIGGAGGFVSSTNTQVQIDQSDETQTSIVFTLQQNGMWAMDSQTTGSTLT
jgi:hypothetical protein